MPGCIRHSSIWRTAIDRAAAVTTIDANVHHENKTMTTSDMKPTPQQAAPFGLSYDAWGRLVLVDSEGNRHVDVAPIRSFPLSDPRRWVSICNAEGREILSIPELDALPEAVRNTLESELARREFVPLIQRIVNITLDSEPTEWTVETDRGPTKFLIEGGEAVRRTGPDRCLISDMQGVRYLIADRKRLDAQSRRLLEQYF
jgi:hypothetical protein